ncbi:hypothetical protein F2P81_013070 [Scophthalmus maximus]|uniref:Uncharacterized protein n=1 Tax=Scophthalmus maximus TaxID=52904 RepID=A0A6A4SZ73_SCOMX|nr:hypothetical protein F2P81_013070 [Scophthalmus maximus]
MTRGSGWEDTEERRSNFKKQQQQQQQQRVQYRGQFHMSSTSNTAREVHRIQLHSPVQSPSGNANHMLNQLCIQSKRIRPEDEKPNKEVLTHRGRVIR